MRLPIALTLTLAGCDQLFGLDRVTYDPPDAPVPDAPDGPCLGTGMLQNLCIRVPATVVLSSAINTNSDPRCRVVPQDAGPELCVLEGETIVVSQNIYVNGERPLVLLAATTVKIEAVVDASSRLGARAGAGAQTCPSSAGSNGTTGAGGGAGGSFGYEGGSGGAGQNSSGAPALGGAPNPPVPMEIAVMGGCAGGSGGVVSGEPAPGGDGGGAVYVIAGSRIEITESGAINASGAGGAGGPVRGGGGGGGSGGFIALDAPELVIEGHVFARGGGGGGGGGESVPGAVGAAPSSATAATPGGSAGGGGALGSNGGNGCGAPDGRAGDFASSAALAGGGGGGGGCGRIHFYGTRTGNGPVNPEPT